MATWVTYCYRLEWSTLPFHPVSFLLHIALFQTLRPAVDPWLTSEQEQRYTAETLYYHTPHCGHQRGMHSSTAR
jgi:hypothetical protein